MKKILLTAMLITFIGTFLAVSTPSALAQDQTIYLPMILKEYEEAVESPEMNLQTFLQETYKNSGLVIIEAIGGIPEELPSQPGASRRNGGAIGMISNVVGDLYTTQPASSVEYLADLGSNLGIISPAYAREGFGWTVFSPILGLWRIFRNIAYLAFVIIFVVIGFMIMFRAKINPQTVISVQNALPRIVVTLLLITFSYAIAGFIVDLGQVLTRIVGNLLVTGKFLGTSPEGVEYSLNDLLGASVFKLINPLRHVGELTEDLLDVQIDPKGLMKPIAWITGKVVFWIAGFFIMFKIFFALIGPYVAIVLSIVFAPLQILLGAIPGAQGGAGGWLRNLAANVLVFPVTFALLCIAAIFKSGPYLSTCPVPPSPMGEYAAWCTPSHQFTLPWAPTTIGNWGAAAGQLIGFGILFTIPKVADIVKNAFAIKPTPAGAAAIEEIRAAIGRVPLLGTFVRV